MKKFETAAIIELDINCTAYGRNPRAVEANAKKGNPNNGAGGSLNTHDETGDFDKEPNVVTNDLS